MDLPSVVGIGHATGCVVQSSNTCADKKIFSSLHPSRPALGPTKPPVVRITGLFRRVKRPGRRADHPPAPSPSSAQVTNGYSHTYTPLYHHGVLRGDLSQ